MAVLRAQLHVSPRGRLEHPELALAPGPAAEGDTGDGSLSALYGYAWALVWDRTRPELVLCRVVDGDLVEVTPSAPLPALTRPARHISLAFDGSARPMIAWQGRAGIFVRQWSGTSGAYVVRGPFDGQDPVLIFDALANGDVPAGDVLLFYLSNDRAHLLARAERDSYGLAYPVADLPPAPSGRPWYLDQVTAAPGQLRVSLATDEIAAELRGLPPAEQDLERLELVSDYYPWKVAEAAVLAPAVFAGAYETTTELHEAAPEVAVLAAAVFAGAYETTTELHEAAPEVAVLAAAAFAGAYAPAFDGADARQNGVTLAATLRGEYRQA